MMRRLMNTRSTSRSFRCFSLTFDILKIIAKSQNAETNLLSHYTGTMLDNTQPTCRRCHHLSYQQQQQVFTILAGHTPNDDTELLSHKFVYPRRC